MLETIPSDYAPICSDMPKKTRLILTKSKVAPNTGVILDFTRAELLERFTLFTIKDLVPSKLTEKELIEFGEKDMSFLKEN